MNAVQISIATIVLSNPIVAEAKEKSLSIPTLADEVNLISMQYREATTRSWLPGCTWFDVLQGTGWFPATFYTDIEPEAVGKGYRFHFGKQGPLAKYCGAKTDNIANFISFAVPIAEGDGEIYGSIPLKFGISSEAEVGVNCFLEEDDFGLTYKCDTAEFNDADELVLNLEFVQ